MQKQKSFKQDWEGVLFLVPTPIGNLKDMTYRAVEILKEADMIAAEDTRNTRKLCNHFDIHTPLTSYHEHNKESSGEKLVAAMKEGKKVALVSDAGLPAISDPGWELVALCQKELIPVIALPGANAAITALIASGLKPQPFYFHGFLNRSKKERRTELEQLHNRAETLIFYEAPHRIKETLDDVLHVLGNRHAAICRELTKVHEEYIRGTVEELVNVVKDEPLKGEICLIIEGGESQKDEAVLWWAPLSIEEHVSYYIEEKGLTSKEAIKQTATDRSMAKRDVYQAYHID
ncbi:16S rRNA (cytidine1402-2'-O)-methyltransferase [Bacillus oleivorans]|uniref:Ribosomal RNA small subunit methyltransferase I n=1 Tax=Bacillus oleivorans TaxID=1448271 RepID=A0A285D7C8_9BACI|nr:16S rRNA (cytidine(1402)-2'-O)-methyltransferase [Bacillus oleivorans]SNX75720.1 16S rRNA (cytidine1402-2'-O)-methyltransferase [Bacillus oleivorans]